MTYCKFNENKTETEDIPIFKNPNECFEYIHKNIIWQFPPNWRLKDPIETYKTKIGSCHDQAYLEKKIFTKMGYKNGLISFIEYNENKIGGCHTLLWFKKDNKIYWFENAWGKKGIHGPYESIKDLKDTIINVSKKMQFHKKYPNISFVVPKAKPGMDINEFIKYSFPKYTENRTIFMDESGILNIYNNIENIIVV